MPEQAMPIIRLDVERMRLGVIKGLTEYAAQMDEDIQQAVNEYCTPEHIASIVRAKASTAIDQVIKEEVECFFRGPGRWMIAQAIEATLTPDE